MNTDSVFSCFSLNLASVTCSERLGVNLVKHLPATKDQASLNTYANSGLFSGVSVWILFTVVNGGVTGLKCVTIWLP